MTPAKEVLRITCSFLIINCILYFGTFAGYFIITSIQDRAFQDINYQAMTLLADTAIFSIFAFLMTVPLILLTSAAFIAGGYAILGRLPLWYGLVLLPPCTIALAMQYHLDGHFYSEVTKRYIAEGLCPTILAYLIVYWRLRKTAPARKSQTQQAPHP